MTLIHFFKPSFLVNLDFYINCKLYQYQLQTMRISELKTSYKCSRIFCDIDRPSIRHIRAPVLRQFPSWKLWSLLASRLYTELSWIPSFDAWMLVTSDRERLFLLKLVNLGRNKCLTIVNVIYSTLIGGIWHYVLEREHKSAIRPFYILNWFLKISLFKFVFFFSPNFFFPRDFLH